MLVTLPGAESAIAGAKSDHTPGRLRWQICADGFLIACAINGAGDGGNVEELQIKCTGDLAVIAAHVQTVLAAEPGLAWLVETNAPGDLYHGIPTIKLVDNLFLFGNVVKVPIDATVVDIVVFREAWPILGHLELFAVAGGCLIEASNRWRGRHVNLEKSGVVWTARDDIAALMPIWERIVAELRRLGLVDKATGGDTKARKTKKKSGAWDDTLVVKLPKLRELRRAAIKGGRVTRTFTEACAAVPIDPETVRRHAPELRARWDDVTYDR